MLSKYLVFAVAALSSVQVYAGDAAVNVEHGDGHVDNTINHRHGIFEHLNQEKIHSGHGMSNQHVLGEFGDWHHEDVGLGEHENVLHEDIGDDDDSDHEDDHHGFGHGDHDDDDDHHGGLELSHELGHELGHLHGGHDGHDGHHDDDYGHFATPFDDDHDEGHHAH